MDIFVYWYWLIAVAVASYLVGSISFATIFAKRIKHADIRSMGSGNAGTTNMFRSFGLRMGVLTFACDAFKGVLCCVCARLLFWAVDSTYMLTAEYIAGLFVVVGHIFSIFYRFRSGKGVATTIGVMFTVQPIWALIFTLPIVAIIFISDRMSVMALSLCVFLVAFHWVVLLDTVGIVACICMTILCSLVIYAHKTNIVRLCHRQEPQLGLRAKLLHKSLASSDQ